MSIRLLQSIFIAGVLSPVDGSTLSLSAALEADLVNQGKAVWVAAPELTASELAHASAHARMRQPNGVPIILAQSAIPMILPSSGTMGANGSLTGLTALSYSVFPQPCFMYFPAGKVFSGSPAGMYYASITGTQAATVYNNMYTSGLPQDAIPAVPTPVVDAGPGAYTQTTGADVELFRVVVPGGILGPHGVLLWQGSWATTNNADAKTVKTKFGALTCLNTGVLVSQLYAELMNTMRNRGINSQTTLSLASGFGLSAIRGQGTENTSADVAYSVTAQLVSVPANNIVMEGCNMIVFPG